MHSDDVRCVPTVFRDTFFATGRAQAANNAGPRFGTGLILGFAVGTVSNDRPDAVPNSCRLQPKKALGGVDSKDSLLGANQIQRCFWGGSLGCDGTVGFERRGVGADSTADHRPA